MPDLLDISGRLEGQVSVTPGEHPEDRAFRIEDLRRTSKIQNGKDIAVFVVLLVSIVLIGMSAAYVGIFQQGASAENKRWAQTVLTIVVSSGVSFVVGKKTAGK